MEKWYVVLTKGGLSGHKKAEANLHAQGHVIYNPIAKVEKMSRGTRVVSIEPVFPGYLFLKIDPEVKSTRSITFTKGVSRMVMFGHRLATVSDDIIESLKEKLKGIVISDLPEAGTQVTLTAGPFAGLDGVFKETDGLKRSLIMIYFLDGIREVSIENDHVMVI